MMLQQLSPEPWPAMYVLTLAIVAINVLPASTLRYYPPSFNEMDSNVSGFVGDTVILKCSVKNLGTKSIIWKIADKPLVLTIGDFVFANDQSYDIEHVKDSENWNLVIKNVQKRHAGRYECQISTKEDLNKTVELTVIDRPIPTRYPQLSPSFPTKGPAVTLTGEKFVEKGNQIILRCNATGESRPPDDIDWFKTGHIIKETYGGHLEITKIREAKTKSLYSELIIKHSKMSDAGVYICRSPDLQVGLLTVNVLNSQTNQTKRGSEKNKNDTNSQRREGGGGASGSAMNKIDIYHILTIHFILILTFRVH